MGTTNQPAPGKKCVPFSISLAVLAPDNKRQVSFGMMKVCNAEDPGEESNDAFAPKPTRFQLQT